MKFNLCTQFVPTVFKKARQTPYRRDKRFRAVLDRPQVHKDYAIGRDFFSRNVTGRERFGAIFR